MRMALAAITTILTLSNAPVRECEADDSKTPDQPSNLAKSYACIKGNFVACLEESRFECQAVSASPMKYLCALEGRPMFLVVASTDEHQRWEVQLAKEAPGGSNKNSDPRSVAR